MNTEANKTRERILLDQSREHYDKMLEKFISDYLRGNRRILAAMEFAAGHCNAKSGALLDIGCGLGWSSQVFANTFPQLQVTGIDFSKVLIHAASEIFSDVPNLNFSCSDITRNYPPAPTKYTAITLLDAYEHIPASSRTFVHQMLREILHPVQGRVILTCPSPKHQAWLAEHHPERLQPVDEVLYREDFEGLAEDLEAHLVYHSYKTVWRTDDYCHVIIAKDKQFMDRNTTGASLVIESRPARFRRIRRWNRAYAEPYAAYLLKKGVNKLRKLFPFE
jgi:2-polyprenyl-3-methyl-5-hydroxy-6-metoxy-1,4-benzoquinol methylase